MARASRKSVDVLIAGAGPTGLALALWLAKSGVGVRIVDKAAEPGTTSRALAVQARTLEFYRQLGFADEVVDRGLQMHAANLWVRGQKAARLPLGEIFTVDEAIERLISDGAPTADIRAHLAGLPSFRPLAQDALSRAARGQVSVEAVFRTVGL